MYDVTVYDAERGRFVPYKNAAGKVYSYSSWGEAAEHAMKLNDAGLGRYNVEYNTVKPRKVRK